jgi:hypothetical protein
VRIASGIFSEAHPRVGFGLLRRNTIRCDIRFGFRKIGWLMFWKIGGWAFRYLIRRVVR